MPCLPIQHHHPTPLPSEGSLHSPINTLEQPTKHWYKRCCWNVCTCMHSSSVNLIQFLFHLTTVQTSMYGTVYRYLMHSISNIHTQIHTYSHRQKLLVEQFRSNFIVCSWLLSQLWQCSGNNQSIPVEQCVICGNVGIQSSSLSNLQLLQCQELLQSNAGQFWLAVAMLRDTSVKSSFSCVDVDSCAYWADTPLSWIQELLQSSINIKVRGQRVLYKQQRSIISLS